jgi:hypothetical protein
LVWFSFSSLDSGVKYINIYVYIISNEVFGLLLDYSKNIPVRIDLGACRWVVAVHVLGYKPEPVMFDSTLCVKSDVSYLCDKEYSL